MTWTWTCSDYRCCSHYQKVSTTLPETLDYPQEGGSWDFVDREHKWTVGIYVIPTDQFSYTEEYTFLDG